jgi:hypothetical protein
MRTKDVLAILAAVALCVAILTGLRAAGMLPSLEVEADSQRIEPQAGPDLARLLRALGVRGDRRLSVRLTACGDPLAPLAGVVVIVGLAAVIGKGANAARRLRTR